MNDSGDSDRTAAIARGYLGAVWCGSTTQALAERLESRNEIILIADDLAAVRRDTLDMESDLTSIRYLATSSTPAASSAHRRVPPLQDFTN